MRFAKLHGLGNDFVLLDLRRGGELLPAERAVELCDRHRGIGADGVLTLLPGDDGVRLVIQNSDGSRPEMCGNGARAAALYLATDGCAHSAPPGISIPLQSDAGPRPCLVWASAPSSGEVEVGMGRAVLAAPKMLPLGAARGLHQAFDVSMGNPHRVLFLDAPRAELQRLAETDGPALCRAENANIEFVARTGEHEYAAVVYERGAGLTQACGTGACAVAAAAVVRGEARRDEPVTVALPGGALRITVDDSLEVRMRGPAQLVYFGELPTSR